MWPLKLVSNGPFCDAALVRLYVNKNFCNKIISGTKVCLHLSQEVADVEKLIGREIE